MREKIIQRSLIGFPMGVFIGYTITVIISVFWGDGNYLAVEPNLVERMGSETAAVAAQYFLSGIIGAGFAGGSLIWEVEHWSIAKRTALHLLLSSLLMFPVAYLLHWMPHNLSGIAMYILIFAGIYAGIWVAQYFSWMRRIQAINRKLRNQ